MEDVLKAIENIKHSKFLQGKTESRKQWVITFDWFVLPNNFPKVLDGNYTDKDQDKPCSSQEKTEFELPDYYKRMKKNIELTPEEKALWGGVWEGEESGHDE